MLLLSIFSLFLTQAYAEATKVCEHIRAMDGSIELFSNEKILVCGTQSENAAWEEVPLPQARFHLNSILQNMGYLQPRFEQTKDSLLVWKGPQTKIQALKVVGAEGILNPTKKRKIIGAPLVSAKIDEVEEWANTRIRSQGYACPEIQVEAHIWDASLVVSSQIGKRDKFGRLDGGDLEGLNRDILDRYQPFHTGDIYDIRKTQIMTNRMLNDGLFQSAYFTTNCEGDWAHLKLHTSIGKPKIFRFGIGASTEEFPFTDISFRNARLDEKASSYTLNFHASPHLLSLDADSELYIIPKSNRSFLAPQFRVSRENESAYETTNIKAGVHLGRKWDRWNTRWYFRVGPTYNYSKTIRGEGPNDSTYPTIEGSLNWMSHLYENSIAEQYEGWTAEFFYRGRKRGFQSELNMNRYEINFKSLWNLGAYAPPFFVLGTRLQAITVDTPGMTQTEAATLVPIDERVFLGGDQNLRGFGRQSLDNEGQGYFTSLYLGFELRLIEELPYHLQPFLLWDVARLGTQKFELNKTVYSSEGLGLRWLTPFGTLRGSAARGRIHFMDSESTNYKEGWVYFLSYGQEF